MFQRSVRRFVERRQLSTALHDQLTSKLSEFGNKTALFCPFTSRKLTYSRLKTLSGCLASWLNNHTPTGRSVATALPNSFEMTVTAVGAIRAGVPLAPLNPHNTVMEIADFLHEVRPRWIVTYSTKVIDILEGMRLSNVTTEDTGLIAIDNDVIYQGVRYFDECLYETNGFTRRDEGGLVVHTGVGTPERISDSNILANCLQMAELDKIEEGQRIAALLPMLHCYGLSHHLFRGLNAGAELVIIPNWAQNFDSTLKALQDSKVSQISTVGAAVEPLLSHSPEAFTGLNEIIVRGKPGPKTEILENTFFGEVIYNYGVTEGPIIYRKSKNDNVSGSVGKLLPQTEAKVVNGDGKSELSTNTAGDILVRGPQLGDGKQWFRSGDTGYFDEQGYFFITGEGSIAIQGLRVHPEEIESAIVDEIRCVKEVAVFRVGDRLAAAVVPKDPYEQPTQKELIDLVASKFAPHKHIHIVVFMSSIPKTAYGKIDRKNLSHSYCPTAHEQLAAVVF